jgi:hypothetical protein
MVADTKKDKIEMVAPAPVAMVRMRARRDVADHTGEVHKAGAEFETTPEFAEQLSKPLKGHYSFYGERSHGAVESHDLTRAERI